MALTTGTRFGPYEVTEPIGAGGMGQVFRARDTKLKRDVALKVVPDAFAHDPERLARFRREAELLASLNHPNIAAVYGFEDSAGVGAIVMEFVDGPTLADRLRVHGVPQALPVNEALSIARQVAEALQTAHDRGIVHRDLKPGNIAFTADGQVKVLDFGLAKALEPAQGSGLALQDGPSNLPTITSPAMTQMGVILGTAAYMSPEQAKGRPADKRSDVWAFGCVLYEMLTGQRAFAGENMSDTLAAVLRGEPDWTKLPADVSVHVRALVKRCLDKDRRQRVGDMAAAIFVIEEPALAGAASDVSIAAPGSRTRERLVWLAVTFGMAALAGAVVFFLTRPTIEPPAAIRFQASPPAGMTFPPGVDLGLASLALSPDGRRLAFGVARDGQSMLALRSFDSLEPQILPGTEAAGGLFPFWSPDSRFVAFFAQGKLKKIDVNGGSPQALCDAPSGRGGTWNRDGTIVFAPEATSGLFRVSSAGGTPIPVTTLDPARQERSHQLPWFLPDGRRFLFVARSPQSPTKVNVASIDGPERTELLVAQSGTVYADGHLLFVREGTLLAQPVDAAALNITGEAFPVAEDVSHSSGLTLAAFSVSATGVLVYRTGVTTELSQLVWFDRRGNRLGTVGARVDQMHVQLSPDGARVAVSELDPTRNTRDITIYDLTRNGLRRKLTFDPADEFSVVWSHEGAGLTFSSNRKGKFDIYHKASSGAGAEELLLDDARNNVYPTSLSPDGRFLLYHTGYAASATSNDIWVLPLFGDRKPLPVVQTPAAETGGQFSPNGRWVAYQSSELGQLRVFVVPFSVSGKGSGGATTPEGKWQVSTGIGTAPPRWRRDGKELFYATPDGLMAAEVNGEGSTFEVGAVRSLFDVRRRAVGWLGSGPGASYDVSADGERFLVNTAVEELVAPPATVVVNWTAGLRK